VTWIRWCWKSLTSLKILVVKKALDSASIEVFSVKDTNLCLLPRTSHLRRQRQRVLADSCLMSLEVASLGLDDQVVGGIETNIRVDDLPWLLIGGHVVGCGSTRSHNGGRRKRCSLHCIICVEVTRNSRWSGRAGRCGQSVEEVARLKVPVYCQRYFCQCREMQISLEQLMKAVRVIYVELVKRKTR